MNSNPRTLWFIPGLPVVLCLCTGCGGHPLRLPDSGPDGAASGSSDALAEDGPALRPDAAISVDAQQFFDAGAADAPDAATSADAPQFLDAVASDSRVGDTGDTGLECSVYPYLSWQPDIPSRQTVRFHFVSSSSGYLITAGIQCGAFLIDRVDGDGGPLALLLGTYQLTICEGPVPSAPGVTTAAALNQPAVSILSWDARDRQPYQVCVDCWHGMPTYTFTFTSSAPVGPGRYRATFAVMDTLPAQCRGGSGEYSCGLYYPPLSPWAPFGPWGLCPEASRTLSVEFDLPAGGDLDVTVVDTQTTNDASSGDAPIERANDVARDAARDDKGIVCGTAVCTPGQVCVIDDPCCYPVPNPNGGQPAPCPTYTCKDIPAGCGEYPDCSCLGVCNGRCPEIMNGTVECTCQ